MCVCVSMVVICKSCLLSLETVSGSMIKVTDTVQLQFPGNTDHSSPQWNSLFNSFFFGICKYFFQIFYWYYIGFMPKFIGFVMIYFLKYCINIYIYFLFIMHCIFLRYFNDILFIFFGDNLLKLFGYFIHTLWIFY